MAGGLPGLIYHQRAQSNEFLLRAVTGTSFLTIRGGACGSRGTQSQFPTNEQGFNKPCSSVGVFSFGVSLKVSTHRTFGSLQIGLLLPKQKILCVA
jgi:hypothetical protein